MCLAAISQLWAQSGPSGPGTGPQVVNPAASQNNTESDNSDLHQAYQDYADKKFSVAAAELQAFVKKSPNTVEAHEMLADIFLRQNQVPQAVPELEAVVRLTPQDTTTRDILGVAYLQVGDADKAAALFQAALTQSPKNANYAFQYATALEKGGKHAEAAAEFEKAAALDPKNSCDPLYAGMLYHQIGDDAKAVPDLKTALALGTTEKFNVYSDLAQAAAAVKHNGDAIQDYALAAQAKPDDFDTEANLGILNQNAGYAVEAETAYRQALTLKADDPKSRADVQSNLAILLTTDGKLDEAAALLVQAAQEQPADTAIQDNLGTVYEKQGKTALALAAYKQALTLSPANDIAQAGAARLSKP
jgi:Flp pilus assembly protein TadD